MYQGNVRNQLLDPADYNRKAIRTISASPTRGRSTFSFSLRQRIEENKVATSMRDEEAPLTKILHLLRRYDCMIPALSAAKISVISFKRDQNVDPIMDGNKLLLLRKEVVISATIMMITIMTLRNGKKSHSKENKVQPRRLFKHVSPQSYFGTKIETSCTSQVFEQSRRSKALQGTVKYHINTSNHASIS
ncbi:hypothetical protein CEXT_760751 [Caerostris extrusa]|uniref:Uncharacterized protein n=1 Tax=Caerostris extrusa TaxID=172846 RepID=A0AAV4U8J7_CAEEX|nr:hypothetical protein CEXT_760751 [Caerostris extrusa]